VTTYSAIADIGDTLVSLLRDRMGDLIDDSDIALASPDQVEPGDDFRLTLYLYDVTENGQLSNEPRPVPDATTQDGSPLVLDLYYLLTAHPSKGGNDKRTTKTMEQHSVLGRAMQVLHDDAIISGSDLKGSLSGGDRIHLSVDSASADRVVNIWNTFQDTPYRPSVSYVATPVIIESTREESVQRVIESDVEEHTAVSNAGEE
jgi:hypothetical protein